MESTAPRTPRLRATLLFLAVIGLAVVAASLDPTTTLTVLGSAQVARPAQVPPPAQPPAQLGSTGCYYRVPYGDNLFRIGLRYGVSYTYLAALNGLPNPNLIYAGSYLSVPCSPYASYVPYVRPANCAPSKTYDVVPGDNLFRIALNFGTTIELLRSANGLYGRVLRSGMHLIVPCPGSVAYRQVPPPSGAPTTTPAPPPPGPTISMVNNQFIPSALSVKVGTTVTWVNNEANGVPHDVVSGLPGKPDQTFQSGVLQPGQTFSFTFNTVGLYGYYASTTPNMTGTITVTP